MVFMASCLDDCCPSLTHTHTPTPPTPNSLPPWSFGSEKRPTYFSGKLTRYLHYRSLLLHKQTKMSSSPVTPAMPLEGAKTLQQRLNILLTKLSRSIEVVKTWPSTDGDDASIHVKTTSKLISSILDIKSALENVEGTLKADAELRKALQSCPIPINLLDLLDHGNGLNPDCFSRGLIRESMGQLAGLKRRKLALEMLGAAVQAGLNKRGGSESNAQSVGEASNQRALGTENESSGRESESKEEGPATKKTKIDS